jgi:hypothetical protein
MKNDLASPIASFTENDVLGDEEWTQTPTFRTRSTSSAAGASTRPTTRSTSRPISPRSSLTSVDGIDRIDTVDYTLTQSNGQAQRLAKQRLERNQYQGRYSVHSAARAGGRSRSATSMQLSHQGLGWSNKLFRRRRAEDQPHRPDEGRAARGKRRDLRLGQ